MTLLGILAVIVALFCFWTFLLRPHLLSEPDHVRAAGYIRAIDAWTATLWANSRAILVARLYIVLPAIVGIHDFIAETYPNLDLTPVWNYLFGNMPDSTRQLVTTGIAIGTGLLFEFLRRQTAPLPPKDVLIAGK